MYFKKFFVCAKTIIVLALLIMIQNCGGKEVENPADMVLINGSFATLEENIPNVKALAIKDGKILAVGSKDEIENYIGDSTEVIDLKNNFAMPGFVESHAHFIGLGESLINIDLRSAKNWDEVIAKIAKAAEKSLPGEWIVGRGWHQEKFDPKPEPNVNGYPVHKILSKAVQNNPVILYHASGHAIFANEKAMMIAGIKKNTPNPNGGTIVRDSLGNAIGVFEENAENLITKFYDEYLSKRKKDQIRADYVKKINLAAEECLKKGITSFNDAGETFDVIDIMKALANSNKLSVRLNVMVDDSLSKMKTKLANYRLIEYGNNYLNVRAIKRYIDGALGSRGAWMLEQYNDLPGSSGSNVTPIDLLKEAAELAIKNNFQMCIHAIGDRGNFEVLNLYADIFSEHPDKKDLRWRIEHAQHVTEPDIRRFAKLGVIAAMQSIHCTSDATFVPVRIGEERAANESYSWRKFIDAGVTVCNGTDSPVEDVNPIKCFYAAVTRKLADGTTFYPDQKMNRTEALKSYTINGAYASFEENIKGSLKPGKLADIVVLSKDILKCNEEEIPTAKVLMTIVGGKVLFEAK
jgi:predicted amidohydrolase YtcJ